MPVAVRAAVPSDAEQIQRLGAGVDEFRVSDGTVTFWPPEILARAIEAPEVAVLVAERDGDLVGFVIANGNPALSKAIVENIYLHPDHPGLGIGSQLLAGLVVQLTVQGYQYLATLVPPGEDGPVAFYEGSGFRRGNTFVWLDRKLSDAFTAT